MNPLNVNPLNRFAKPPRAKNHTPLASTSSKMAGKTKRQNSSKSKMNFYDSSSIPHRWSNRRRKNTVGWGMACT